jgi:hypothetical protein
MGYPNSSLNLSAVTRERSDVLQLRNKNLVFDPFLIAHSNGLVQVQNAGIPNTVVTTSCRYNRNVY